MTARSASKLPSLVHFKRTGEVGITTIQPGSSGVDAACPETHFWCLDKDYCLPVFVRCNGVYDCPGHEDEEGCDVYTCPGFYRCRASKVCVHVTHVCNDRPQCPQQDDELLCNRLCPLQCTCLGLAFFCSQVFEAHQFTDLRYLDVRGSGMNMHHLSRNSMLMHLSLAMCSIKSMTNFTFHNLHSLDLSDNLLTEVSAQHFAHMPHLTVLFLAGNPLTSVFTNSAGSRSVLPKLNRLDLSRIKMYSVNRSLFLSFPSLQFLNLSHSGVELLQWNSSQMSVAPLQELDLRGCEIAEFPRDVLRGFLHLQSLHSDNFRLCCPSVLPPGFDLNHCHVTPDDVSTCDHLLGSGIYRVAVAVLATLALIGNVGRLTVRMCAGKTWQMSSSGVVLTHLSVADLGMGLHLMTLGLTDRLLAGHYVWRDGAWRRGLVCHVTGFLAMSCRHAATFCITILTLDRCFQRCPALTLLLTATKVKGVCVLVWVSSVLVATVPSMSHWQFFGQQALCVPLPHKTNNSLEFYAFGVMALGQFVMFVLCCVCEVIIRVCSTITKSDIMSRSHCPNNSQFVVLGSLTSGLLYTITCLVPADPHNDRQRAIHTAVVYLGSVVSCAINPYLHLYGVRVARSKRIKEERLLRIVSRARV